MTTFDSNLFAKLESRAGYAETNNSSVLNPYVAFNSHKNTQQLADVLVAEAVQMRGVECFYLPRDHQTLDPVFGEDPQNSFTKAFKFAAYLDSFDAYSGANTFYSKFGMSVNDEITLTINPNLFKHQTEREAREGDLIYFKMDNSLFEITWVQPYDPFYQTGVNSIQKITAQKFNYSGEKLAPELQATDAIEIDEFMGLELDPVRELNGITDQYIPEFNEVEAINKEGAEYIEPYVVANGGKSPFEDF